MKCNESRDGRTLLVDRHERAFLGRGIGPAFSLPLYRLCNSPECCLRARSIAGNWIENSGRATDPTTREGEGEADETPYLRRRRHTNLSVFLIRRYSASRIFLPCACFDCYRIHETALLRFPSDNLIVFQDSPKMSH